MTDRRRERQRQQQREALERALDVVEQEGLDALSLPDLGEAVGQRALLARLPDPEALFFQDHPELMEGLQEALSQRASMTHSWPTRSTWRATATSGCGAWRPSTGSPASGPARPRRAMT